MRKFKKALITGISGSGGSFLAEYILKNHKTVKVFGFYRQFRKINLDKIDLDFLTLSGHKIGAPTGIGALVYNNKTNITPQILGGGQEKGMRAGTENILGIKGFGEAAKLLTNKVENNCFEVKYLRDYFLDKIKILSPKTGEIRR